MRKSKKPGDHISTYVLIGFLIISLMVLFQDVAGFSNFNGVQEPVEGLKYIFKYLLKAVFNPLDNVVGMALQWLYGKRSFSVSRGFLDLIGVKSNSSVNTDWMLIGFRFGDDVRYIVDGVDASGYSKFDDPFLEYALTKHLIIQSKLG